MRLLLLLLTFGVVIASSGRLEAATTDSKSGKAVSKKVTKKSSVKKSVKSSAKKSKAGQKTAAVGPTKAKEKAKSDLSTDVKFDDSTVHGQYQTPDEALASVENEKGLNDLIGVRKHFKDRLQTASGQE